MTFTCQFLLVVLQPPTTPSGEFSPSVYQLMHLSDIIFADSATDAGRGTPGDSLPAIAGGIIAGLVVLIIVVLIIIVVIVFLRRWVS